MRALLLVEFDQLEEDADAAKLAEEAERVLKEHFKYIDVNVELEDA